MATTVSGIQYELWDSKTVAWIQQNALEGEKVKYASQKAFGL